MLRTHVCDDHVLANLNKLHSTKAKATVLVARLVPLTILSTTFFAKSFVDSFDKAFLDPNVKKISISTIETRNTQ